MSSRRSRRSLSRDCRKSLFSWLIKVLNQHRLCALRGISSFAVHKLLSHVL
jgi:hypothetical protein